MFAIKVLAKSPSVAPMPTTGTTPAATPLATAARDAGAVWAGLFALGIGFGVLVTEHGLPWWLAPVISTVVLAGSAEFLLAGMLAAAAPVAAIAVTTFLVNCRHLFYGLSFPLHRVEGRWARGYSVFALTDEAYALLTARDDRELSSARVLWTQGGLHLSWAAGSLVGAVAGPALLGGLEGLDFVLTALFVVLALDAYRACPDRLALLTALASAGFAWLVAPGSLLLVALCCYTTALVVRHRREVRRG